MRPLGGGPDYFAPSYAWAAMMAWAIPASVFWPYFDALAILAIGLPVIFKEIPQVQGADKVLPLGRMFYALPMVVFAAEHFTGARGMSQIVPSWIPFRVFWVYLVAFALVAAALALVTRIQAPLAALLAGIMFLLFVCLIHLPNAIEHPGDRFRWAVAFRDSAFGGGPLAYAGGHANEWGKQRRHALVNVGRIIIGVTAIFFAVEHFLHPTHMPGVPLAKEMVEWIPARPLWGYLTGATLLICGLGILLKRKARLAATCLGVEIVFMVLLVYLPTLVLHPSDIGNEMNYFADTMMFSGTILLLAAALPREDRT